MSKEYFKSLQGCTHTWFHLQNSSVSKSCAIYLPGFFFHASAKHGGISLEVFCWDAVLVEGNWNSK